MALKLITYVELSALRQGAQFAYNEAKGDATIAEFRERITKGNRYLAGLRDQDPKPQEKIAAAEERLAGIEKELREFRVKYELPLRVYEALEGLLKVTANDKSLNLTRTVPGEASGLHNALQINMEDIKVSLLLDLSYDGIPF
jgi:hypothetical protein